MGKASHRPGLLPSMGQWRVLPGRVGHRQPSIYEHSTICLICIRDSWISTPWNYWSRRGLLLNSKSRKLSQRLSSSSICRGLLIPWGGGRTTIQQGRNIGCKQSTQKACLTGASRKGGSAPGRGSQWCGGNWALLEHRMCVLLPATHQESHMCRCPALHLLSLSELTLIVHLWWTRHDTTAYKTQRKAGNVLPSMSSQLTERQTVDTLSQISKISSGTGVFWANTDNECCLGDTIGDAQGKKWTSFWSYKISQAWMRGRSLQSEPVACWQEKNKKHSTLSKNKQTCE